jgi:RNA polymerase sigma factor (sigma-70 family)
VSEESPGRKRLPDPDPLVVAWAQERTPEGHGTERSRNAYTILHTDYSPAVFRRFCRTLRSRDEAAAATHEVFVRVWDGLPGKNSDAPFVAWLFTIAVNWERNYWRDQNKIQIQVVSLSEPLSPSTADVEVEVMRRELLRAALAKLTQEAYEVLVLHHELGFSVKEIARDLGVSVSAVEKRLVRAHQRFREVIDPSLAPQQAPRERTGRQHEQDDKS